MSPPISYTIVDQQEHFIVVDKQANVNFHDEDNIGHGLFNQVKTQLNMPDLFPVHRLDKMTSGLIVFAKNLAAAQLFQQLFSEHSIEKYYLAISDKKPNKKQGAIIGDMAKSRRGTWKLLRTMDNPAITQFFSYSIGKGLRLYILKPKTGKTHQIRVALNSIGAPIIGDPNYYGHSNADRGYLHAYAISFEMMGKHFSYVSMPKEGELYHTELVEKRLKNIESPWQLTWPKLK